MSRTPHAKSSVRDTGSAGTSSFDTQGEKAIAHDPTSCELLLQDLLCLAFLMLKHLKAATSSAYPSGRPWIQVCEWYGILIDKLRTTKAEWDEIPSR